MRINEFLLINPEVTVVGLREGTLLLLNGSELTLKGSKSCKIFYSGKEPFEVFPGGDLHFLLH